MTELDPDELNLMADNDVLALAFQLEQTAHFIDALLIRVAGTLDTRSAPSLEDSLAKKAGCRNTVELLQRLSQRSAAALGRRLNIARATRTEVGISGSPVPPRFPAVAAALSEGRLPEDSAHQIIKSLKALPSHVDPTHIVIAERSIVAQAAGYPLDSEDEQCDESGQIDGADSSDTPLPQDCDTVRLICERWCAFLDQDGREPSDEQAMSDRYFRLGREKNGLVPAHGLLTPDTAALIGNLFSAINSPLTATNSGHRPNPDADDMNATDSDRTRSGVRFVESATESCGATECAHSNGADGGIDDEESVGKCDASCPEYDGETTPRTETDKRSYGQKVHDALRIVAEIAARAAETPQIGGAPVTVLIQTTQEDLAISLQQDLDQLSETAWGNSTGSSNAGSLSSGASTPGVAWLHGHDGVPSPVSMAVARHGICTGATQRVITGPRGEILGIESSTRIFTPHQRRAITARDGGCIIPGCSVPAAWCEVHHVTEWSKGGATTTDNGVLLCWYHHRNIDSNDWHIRMVDGLPEVLAPPWVDPHQKWRRTRPPLRTNPAQENVSKRRARARSS